MVSVYHIWFQRVSGGVDVFFVVAAFFLTRAIIKHDLLSVPHILNYYLSTFKRLVPVAYLIIIVTVAGSIVILPTVVWVSEIEDAVASVFFVENWNLAASNANYLDQGTGSSAYQQYWALSVQAQFYVLFPALIYLGDRISRKVRTSRLNTLLALFGSVGMLSFIYGVYRTTVDQPFTYFDSLARCWEFAAGSIAALIMGRFNPPRKVMYCLGTLALAGLLVFGRMVDVSGLFPGYVALVPVIAALVIILAAQVQAGLPLLTWKPVVWAGDYSFAFYLWHWPLLVFGRVFLKDNDPDLVAGISIILAAAILAYVSTRWVELPFRRNAWLVQRPIHAAIACMLVAVLPLGATAAWYRHTHAIIRAADEDVAAYLASGRLPRANALVPHPVVARRDLPPMYNDGCNQDQKSDELVTCTYGNPEAGKTLALVGGSHSAQWIDPLLAIADHLDFKIVSMTKSACAFQLGDDGEREVHPSCIDWNNEAIGAILRLKPDLVFTIATRLVNDREGTPESYRRAWAVLQRNGIPILALRDNPWFPQEVPYCLELNPDAPESCAIRTDSFYDEADPALERKPPNVHLLDLSGRFCDQSFCRPTEGHVLKYRDKHHLTRAYIMSFKEDLEKELKPLL
jgi:peptidoglycan/LPS O-acetylase OafA/YrhL